MKENHKGFERGPYMHADTSLLVLNAHINEYILMQTVNLIMRGLVV